MFAMLPCIPRGSCWTNSLIKVWLYARIIRLKNVLLEFVQIYWHTRSAWGTFSPDSSYIILQVWANIFIFIFISIFSKVDKYFTRVFTQ